MPAWSTPPWWTATWPISGSRSSPNIQPQPAVALAHQWADCLGHSQGQPRAQESARRLRREERIGTMTGNCILKRYLKNTRWARKRHHQGRHAPLQRAHRLFQEIRHAVRLRLAAARRAGLPGIAARPEHAQSGGRDRRHAGDAHHGAATRASASTTSIWSSPTSMRA